MVDSLTRSGKGLFGAYDHDSSENCPLLPLSSIANDLKASKAFLRVCDAHEGFHQIRTISTQRDFALSRGATCGLDFVRSFVRFLELVCRNSKLLRYPALKLQIASEPNWRPLWTRVSDGKWWLPFFEGVQFTAHRPRPEEIIRSRGLYTKHSQKCAIVQMQHRPKLWLQTSINSDLISASIKWSMFPRASEGYK